MHPSSCSQPMTGQHALERGGEEEERRGTHLPRAILNLTAKRATRPKHGPTDWLHCVILPERSGGGGGDIVVITGVYSVLVLDRNGQSNGCLGKKVVGWRECEKRVKLQEVVGALVLRGFFVWFVRRLRMRSGTRDLKADTQTGNLAGLHCVRQPSA